MYDKVVDENTMNRKINSSLQNKVPFVNISGIRQFSWVSVVYLSVPL